MTNLIAQYELNLEKVKESYPLYKEQTHQGERHADYVKYAEQQLEEVKNGRDW